MIRSAIRQPSSQPKSRLLRALRRLGLLAVAGLLALLFAPQPASQTIAAGPSRSTVLVTSPPTEDIDGDGAFDVFEDFDHDGRLDPGEDLDGDGRLTPRDGCEGRWREDQDCDGRLDSINEDLNGNGILDPGEDVDGDGLLEYGIEDRNGNSILDDRPFPTFEDPIQGPFGDFDPLYPYESIRPAAGGVTVTEVDGGGAACQCITTGPAAYWEALVEDPDGDGLFDVFEDFNHNGLLDEGEDLDGDARVTPPDGCEGSFREDQDCDGHLDAIDEDANHNGILDPGEDLDADSRLDRGAEDRNGDGVLNDRPLVTLGDRDLDETGAVNPLYPYGSRQPALSGRFTALTVSKTAECGCGVVF